MTLNLKKFSLGKVQVTIKRYTGSYINGIYTRALDSTFTEWVSVQPYSTIEQDQLLDPDAGDRIDEIRLMYSPISIRMNDDKNPATPGDLITIMGEDWEPVKVEPWLHLDIEHYRVLLRRYDGA
jgi:hypothetical protein